MPLLCDAGPREWIWLALRAALPSALPSLAATSVSSAPARPASRKTCSGLCWQAGLKLGFGGRLEGCIVSVGGEAMEFVLLVVLRVVGELRKLLEL